MRSYEIIWPADFNDYAWLIESKGWLTGVQVRLGERVLEPVFYDKTRLQQTVEDDLSSTGRFVEGLIIVVDRVTKQSVEKVLDDMDRSGHLARLR